MEEKNKKRVLIVDDDPFILRLYIRLFELSEFEVVGASNGEDAKKTFKNSPAGGKFDIAVLDIKLPDSDGFTIAQFIRADENLKNMKIVIFSGFADRPEIIEKCKSLDIACVLKGKEPPAELVIKAINLLSE